MFKSKFRFHGEFTGALFVAFFAIGGLIKLFLDPYDTRGEKVGGIFIVFLMFIWAVFIWVIHSILKIPTIIILGDRIIFKNIFSIKELTWQNIVSIELTGKRKPSFMHYPEEVCIIKAVTGEEMLIRIECYRNSAEIRGILEKVKISVSNDNTSFRINPEMLQAGKALRELKAPSLEQPLTKYSGNLFLNFKALMIYAFPIALIVNTYSTIRVYPERTPILLIPIIVFYLALGFNQHYFLFSDKRLIVKNPFWFWKTHIYFINNLHEVVFEAPGKMSHSLRIITKDFETKIYPAAGLRNKHWREIKSHFGSLGIKIRDEIGF